VQWLSAILSVSIWGEEGLRNVPWAQQGQELVGTSALVIITERVDDVALLIGPMVQMGCVEGRDRPIPRHWQQRARSWGWTAVIWLASLLTEGDHRKVAVDADIQGMHHTLSRLSGHSHSAPLGW
jgi:hypothetical protein